MAAPSLRFHPDAVAEAEAACKWYAERNPSAANAFVAELEHAIRQILSTPDGWPIHIQGTRKILFRRFPYAVIYRTIESTIQIIAVAHGRRRPGYWKSRRL